MSNLRKLRVGRRYRGLPAATINELVDVALEGEGSLSTIDDTRRPKAKSPVIVRLVWDGGSPLEPGHTVKLGTALFDPTTDESAPFSGLSFHCTAFVGMDGGSPYAITLGPIDGGGTGIGYGFIPEATWAKVNITNDTHTTATWPASGTLLVSATAGPIPIIWKPAGTGEKWCVVPLGTPGPAGTAEPPLREFELTVQKTHFQNTATAKFLDHNGNMVGDPVTLHDPDLRFSGRVANYLPFEGGFRGLALQRTDLATSNPGEPRWDIVAMEGMASWAVIECYSLVPQLFVLRSFGGGTWDQRAPAELGSPIGGGVQSDMASQLGVGRSFYAKLANPDTLPPSYIAVAIRTAAQQQGPGGVEFFEMKVPGSRTIPACSYQAGKKIPGKFTAYLEARDAAGKYEPVGPLVEIENRSPDEFKSGEYGTEGRAMKELVGNPPVAVYSLDTLYCDELDSSSQLPNP